MKILIQRIAAGDWAASMPELEAAGRGRNAAEAVGRLVIDFKPLGLKVERFTGVDDGDADREGGAA